MKFRDGKLKKEHGNVPGLTAALAAVNSLPEVTSVIPGPIKPCRHGGGAKHRLKVQYQTGTGLKCLFRGSTAIQEVFIVTKDPEVVKAEIMRD